MKYLALLMILASCSSGFVPTTDKCSIQKHIEDSVWQILENGEPINKKWYLRTDAISKIKRLEKLNVCNWSGKEIYP